MAKITILGSGGFGTALAIMAQKYHHEVTLWSAFENELEDIRRDSEHKKLLPGVPISPSISLTVDPACVAGADIIIVAVPSFVIRKTVARIAPFLSPRTIVASVAKGLEDGTLKRLSQVISEEIPNPVVVISGPSHAEEVARGIPTTVVVASNNMEAAMYVQDALMNPTFRIYCNNDLIGVELGGSLKNVIALAAGISDGCGLGDNTKAALMTRGITEIARLGIAMGGSAETFAGLSGIGDLIVTCTSMHSRNRRAGILIGQGMTADAAIKQVGMTVEGYPATKTAWTLAKREGISMPIVEQMYQVLYHNKNTMTALNDLMSREKKHEFEQIWMER